MAFPMYQEWYLIEHDALVRLVAKHTNWLHTKSWQEDGNYSSANPNQRLVEGCFRHQLLLPRPYLVLTKPLRLDIQCQRGASVKIGWKYLDD